MLQIENPITTPPQDFELVVEIFHKSTVGSVNKVIGDFHPPIFQGFQELIKAVQPTELDVVDPGLDFAFSNCFRNILVKDGGQLFAQT
jgi:hypothetical protein